MTIEAGTRIGRYEIQSLLGAGGMGEVYRALDTELNRPVALKFLHEDVASDQKRMNRFIQEARAASALNHPNILTVYEIGQINGGRFFATEFVDGITLRQRMMSRMKLEEVLDIVRQVARALVAAHAAGIVHRDIKPENIMIRKDGYVKVLDFGLAKVTETRAGSIDTEAATQALVNTDPGAVMGTVGYMSPEQAAGREVDARTDLWSLGAVLYEMVTGHLPFEGKSPSHVIVAITDKDPLPLARYVNEVPEALEWIVTETLTKDREERTQTAKELLKKLQRLKQRLDAGAELERSVAPEFGSVAATRGDSISGAGTTSISSADRAPATVEGAAPTTRSGQATSTVSSAEYLVSGLKQHKKAALVALVLILLVAGGIVFAWYRLSSPSKLGSDSKMKITRLISGQSGQLSSITISPDGRYVAYALDESGKSSLWVRQVSQNTSLQVVPPAEETRFIGATFSHDGEIIYFGKRASLASPQGALYQVPVLGGREPKKIIDHINSPISLSPDGKRFAFVRSYQDIGESVVMVANIDGSGEAQKLAMRKGDDWFNNVAWSPDGQRLACAANSVRGGFTSTVVEIPHEGGPEKSLTSHKWNGEAHRLLWLSDGSGLIVSVSERPSYHPQVWTVAFPGGEARRVTNDLNTYGTISLGVTSDSSTIVTILEEKTSKIWVAAPNEDESRARKLTNGKYDGDSGLDLLSDGRIVYSTRAGDNEDLWMMNADGAGSKPLTSDAYVDSRPRVSPDGRYIFFASERPDHLTHIWRIDADGNNPKQLTTAEDFDPTCSPDGRWIVFASFRTGVMTLWKVAIDGGEAVQVSDKLAGEPVFSPDGKLLACSYYDQSTSPPRWRPALISFEDGSLIKVLDLPTTARRPIWSADGREFIYVDTRAGVGNLWSQPVAGGSTRQLTKFTSESISSFAIAADGKRFVITRSTGNDDIVLIKDFR